MNNAARKKGGLYILPGNTSCLPSKGEAAARVFGQVICRGCPDISGLSSSTNSFRWQEISDDDVPGSPPALHLPRFDIPFGNSTTPSLPVRDVSDTVSRTGPSLEEGGNARMRRRRGAVESKR